VPHNGRLVLFNRVPKCGSTSLEKIIRQQAAERRFAFVSSTDYVNNSLDTEEQTAFTRSLNALSRRQPRMLYDRHILYVDFAALGQPAPLYINLLREPLHMQLSAFYFWRECVCVTHQPFCASARAHSSAQPSARDGAARALHGGLCQPGYTIDRLYANVSARPSIGLMTRWFCGHGRACGGGRSPPSQRVRDEALRRALSHLRERYTWVGVLERLEDSLRLLAQLLPAFFGKLAVERAAREHVRPRTSSSRYSYPTPAPATLAKLRHENANDLTLYAAALDVLDCKLQRCGLVRGAPRDGRAPPPVPSSRPRAAPDDRDSAPNLGSGPHVTANAAAAYVLRRRHHRQHREAAPAQDEAEAVARRRRLQQEEDRRRTPRPSSRTSMW
jgi:hypothetical protein